MFVSVYRSPGTRRVAIDLPSLSSLLVKCFPREVFSDLRLVFLPVVSENTKDWFGKHLGGGRTIFLATRFQTAEEINQTLLHSLNRLKEELMKTQETLSSQRQGEASREVWPCFISFSSEVQPIEQFEPPSLAKEKSLLLVQNRRSQKRR